MLDLLLNVYIIYEPNTHSSNTTTSTTTTLPTNNITTTANSSLQAFNNSEIYPFSYLISRNGTLSGIGRIAAYGIKITTRTVTNGTIYSLKFESGVTYNVTMPHSSRLYFMDTSLGDDGPGGDQYYTGDDGYAAVNAQGYITSGYYPLPNS